MSSGPHDIPTEKQQLLWVVTEKCDLSEAQREQLYLLLLSYAYIFAQGNTTAQGKTLTTLIESSIPFILGMRPPFSSGQDASPHRGEMDNMLQ